MDETYVCEVIVISRACWSSADYNEVYVADVEGPDAVFGWVSTGPDNELSAESDVCGPEAGAPTFKTGYSLRASTLIFLIPADGKAVSTTCDCVFTCLPLKYHA
jgi:hypothetical protein